MHAGSSVTQSAAFARIPISGKLGYFSHPHDNSMRTFRTILVIAALAALTFFLTSGRFLVINEPQKSDIILVLAGETEQRPARALELLHQGFASHMILDVPAEATIYDWAQTDLAQKYVESLGVSDAVTVCPIHGLSTKAEAKDAAVCLKGIPGRNLLLVTSDFHTRRALSIFQRELPNYNCRVAAAYDARQFGAQWWLDRQWAKVNFDEWLRLAWWTTIDRWR